MPRFKSKIQTNKDLTQALASSLRNAKRTPYIYNYVPHDKQIEFHSSTKTGRLFLGGNRSGKTVGGGTELVYYASGMHPYKRLKWEPPLRLRAVAVDFEHGIDKIVKPELKRWIPPSYLINGSWEDSYNAQLKTLTFSNGSTIEFMSFEQELDKFAGTSRHGIWLDEEPPKDIWTECKLRLLDTNGDWWMTMTPVQGMTWTYFEIYDKPDESIDIIEVDMDDNPYLDPVGKLTVLAGLSEQEQAARQHGQFVPSGGFIYPEFRPFVHVVDSFVPPKDWLWLCSLDAGFTNPTAWLWMAVDREGRIVVFDEHYKSNEIVAWHAQKVHEKNGFYSHYPDYYVGDPSIRNIDQITGTSVLIEYLDCGIPIILGTNDVRAGIDRIKKKLIGIKGKPLLYITSNCTNLLWEIKKYRWGVWKERGAEYEKNKKEEPMKKDDHACDSLRYGVASRPEREDFSVPKPVYDLAGASIAVDPSGIFDRGSSSAKTRDYHLGEEF